MTDKDAEAPRQAALVVAATEGLRALGQRVTPARRAVVEVLAATDSHLDAEQVGRAVAQRFPGVHRATVYRTLETLAGLGLLTHVHTSRGGTAYHLAGTLTGRDHLHAQCRVCGKILDLPADLLDDAAARVREHGFLLEADHVALSGICEECSDG